ncbi:MAG: hypothetical protein QM809_09935 [Gordonia sp. (in: high G+C Gram-positive bacteria)]|uniref:hypothetical protein n=1 Tax=Gordonia sp. (in: high G+C Gram-positive bacteria) TaxID=84139 RepID=UPI0039E574FB
MNDDVTVPTTDPKPTLADRARDRMRVLILWGIAAGVLVALYFILSAFLPRWWAGRVGEFVGDSFVRGTFAGLLLGGVCTAFTLSLFGAAAFALLKHRRVGAILAAAGALVVSIPNLLTLSVVVGTGHAAHAGQRIFDVEAPAFRASTLWGVILGGVIGLVVCYFLWRYHRRGRRLAEAEAALESRESAPIPDPGPGTAGL